MPVLAYPAALTHPTAGIYYARENDEAASVERRVPNLRGTSVSYFWLNRARFDDVRARLRRAAMLQPDSYDGDPPNQTAQALAAKVLAVLEAEALPPSRLLPSVEGGIAISFADGAYRAEIEVYNTGEIAAAAYSGQDEPVVWEFAGNDAGIRTAIEQIRVHLSH